MSGHVTIQGQKVPWSFIAKVRKALGDDNDRLMDCFWKAREAENIVAYVAAGFRKDEKGNCYSMLASTDRENGHMQRIRDWWRTSVHQPKARPSSMAAILRSIIDGTE